VANQSENAFARHAPQMHRYACTYALTHTNTHTDRQTTQKHNTTRPIYKTGKGIKNAETATVHYLTATRVKKRPPHLSQCLCATVPGNYLEGNHPKDGTGVMESDNCDTANKFSHNMIVTMPDSSSQAETLARYAGVSIEFVFYAISASL